MLICKYPDRTSGTLGMRPPEIRQIPSPHRQDRVLASPGQMERGANVVAPRLV